jgi:TfoX/Sxy family transcriptional regulator of competence genes
MSVAIFGCEIDQFEESVLESLTYKHSGGSMVLMSLLSDVQEMIERDDKEGARQTVNRVKYLISQAGELHPISFK